jgi:hypothetical protein
MTASVANSSEFLIASDLRPCDSAWTPALAQMEEVRRACASVLGFDPRVRLVSVPSNPGEGFDVELGHESFVIPAALDFSLWQRERLGQLLAEARRGDPNTVVHHDDVDPGHPLVVDALADQAARALGNMPPQQAGLLLVASGHGDPASRAQSYRLMRLLWERLGFARAEVAFVRNAKLRPIGASLVRLAPILCSQPGTRSGSRRCGSNGGRAIARGLRHRAMHRLRPPFGSGAAVASPESPIANRSPAL